MRLARVLLLCPGFTKYQSTGRAAPRSAGGARL